MERWKKSEGGYEASYRTEMQEEKARGEYCGIKKQRGL
jgi:hypothetical protein